MKDPRDLQMLRAGTARKVSVAVGAFSCRSRLNQWRRNSNLEASTLSQHFSSEVKGGRAGLILKCSLRFVLSE